MRFLCYFTPLLLISLTGISPCVTASGAPMNSDEPARTLDDFRDRYFVANNGKDKMLSVQSMRVEAVLSRPGEEGGKIIYIKQKPNYVRSVWYGPKGVVLRHGYNGVVAWEMVTFPDGTEKGRISNEVPGDVFEWVIASPESCGATLELLPLERLERSENYHVRATFASGVVKDYYIDTMTFCETKVIEKSKDGTVKTYVVETPQKFDGIWFPGVQIEYDQSGKEIARVEVKDVQMNIGLLPCFFDCPKALQPTPEGQPSQNETTTGR
jgi:hypothetical protein